MPSSFEERRFLIWGKTAPELSSKHFETVCTGAVLEDGNPIRLYPIPFRYLTDGSRFKKYQWMTAKIKKDTYDTRPESYKIDCDSIELGDLVKPDSDEWAKRAEIMFRNRGWQFVSVDELAAAEASSKLSIGVVDPKEILSVDIVPRSDDEEASFEAKRERVRAKWQAQSEGVFEEFLPDELKGLEFIRNRIQIKWICGSGAVHKMQVIDWEVIELQRKAGDESARQKITGYMDLSKYAIRFFLGNLKSHRNRFMIAGLWYPKRREPSAQGELF
jgi:hypothetical protein